MTSNFMLTLLANEDFRPNWKFAKIKNDLQRFRTRGLQTPIFGSLNKKWSTYLIYTDSQNLVGFHVVVVPFLHDQTVFDEDEGWKLLGSIFT